MFDNIGGRGCCDSHLRVSHWGLSGGVSISGGGLVGPIFWRGLSINGGLVNWLLWQGGNRHQGIGLIFFVHLERLGLRRTQSQNLSAELVLEMEEVKTDVEICYANWQQSV